MGLPAWRPRWRGFIQPLGGVSIARRLPRRCTTKDGTSIGESATGRISEVMSDRGAQGSCSAGAMVLQVSRCPGFACLRTPLWDADVEKDLHHALHSTADQTLVDSLCCGRFGRAERFSAWRRVSRMNNDGWRQRSSWKGRALRVSMRTGVTVSEMCPGCSKGRPGSVLHCSTVFEVRRPLSCRPSCRQACTVRRQRF